MSESIVKAVPPGSYCTRKREPIRLEDFLQFLLDDHLCRSCAEQPIDSEYAQAVIASEKGMTVPA